MAKHNTQPVPQLPSLDPEGDGFNTWKGDINLWVSVTKVPVNQRATIIYLSLTGKAKLYAEKIPNKELQETQGVQFLLKTLEDHFFQVSP